MGKDEEYGQAQETQAQGSLLQDLRGAVPTPGRGSEDRDRRSGLTPLCPGTCEEAGPRRAERTREGTRHQLLVTDEAEEGLVVPTIWLRYSRVIHRSYDLDEVGDDGEPSALLIIFSTDEDHYDDSFEARYSREIEEQLKETYGGDLRSCYWDEGYIHVSWKDSRDQDRLHDVAQLVHVLEQKHEEALEIESKERVADLIHRYDELPLSHERRLVANHIATAFLREACEGNGVSLDQLVQKLASTLSEGRSS